MPSSRMITPKHKAQYKTLFAIILANTKGSTMKTIAIIGRPNVGKSSLFNRLAKSRIAITSHIAGTTRDTNTIQITLHNGQSVRIVDTGGIEDTSDELFTKVAHKARQAAKVADLILYLVDGKLLPTQEDKKLFFTLQKSVPALLVINKIDNDSQKELAYNFAEFGTKAMYFISVSHNRGISQLLNALESTLFPEMQEVAQDMEEELLEALENTKQAELESTMLDSSVDDHANKSTSNGKKTTASKNSSTAQSLHDQAKDSRILDPRIRAFQSSQGDKTSVPLTQQADEIPDLNQQAKSAKEKPTTDLIQVGIIGRVNVGKSSILNALVGYERSVVSAQAGTTIDPVDEQITFEGSTLRFVDTAGIRRKGKIESLEKYALDRTSKVLEQADIAILVLDSSAPLVELDEKIFSLVQKHALGVIVVWNKWDIAHTDFNNIRADFLRRFRFLEYAPFLTLSALKGRHIKELKRKILEVYTNYASRIPTSKLNDTIAKAVRTHPIPSDHGKLVKIYYATQYATKPPQIALISNRPKSLHFSYKRFLVNQLRKEFGLSGTPILLAPRPKGQGNPESI